MSRIKLGKIVEKRYQRSHEKFPTMFRNRRDYLIYKEMYFKARRKMKLFSDKEFGFGGLVSYRMPVNYLDLVEKEGLDKEILEKFSTRESVLSNRKRLRELTARGSSHQIIGQSLRLLEQGLEYVFDDKSREIVDALKEFTPYELAQFLQFNSDIRQVIDYHSMMKKTMSDRWGGMLGKGVELLREGFEERDITADNFMARIAYFKKRLGKKKYRDLYDRKRKSRYGRRRRKARK